MSAPADQPLRSSSSPMPLAARILAWWSRRSGVVLAWAAALMGLAALVWLGYQTWRLLWQPPPMGAVDLEQRWTETRALFAGQAVYRVIGTASYPPPSLTMLWPILGWPSLATARWLWALLTVGALVWMVRVVVRASGATTKAERRVAMLLPLAMYATGAATGNGQLTVPVDGQKVWAGSLLAAMLVSTLAPGGPYLLPAPWNEICVAAQVVVWLAGCVFLLRAAALWGSASSAAEQ